MSYLWHVTLTTGHARRSYRSEVDDAAVEKCWDLITQALKKSCVPIPIPGYELAVVWRGKCLVATVWHIEPAGTLRARSREAPVCTIGIAAHSRCGAQLWRDLHRYGEIPVATDPERCPGEPWVAVALDAGMRSDAMSWLGDFERCLAWAWLERKKHPDAT